MRNLKERLCYTLLIFLAAAVLFSIAYCLNRCGQKKQPDGGVIDSVATVWAGERRGDYIGNTSSIAIPGWEYINLKADSIDQCVNFRNPPENSCLFKMTLFVDDNEVWASELTKPGYGFYDIQLSQSYPAGEHGGKLIIQCYDVNGSELSSATVYFKTIFR